jgi:uncharacterized protein YjbI with pentapeptide repeats
MTRASITLVWPRSPRIRLAAQREPQRRQIQRQELGGADLRGADVTDADFHNADVTSARFIGLRGRDKARNFDHVQNLDRAFRD